jgi:uncharacterized protein (TIGR01777 family)
MTIVIVGGSGFIGTQLSRALLGLGDTVIVVDKVAPRFTHEHLYYISCDVSSQELPFNVLEHTDAVINLAGAPISKKWTKEYKQQIYDSRIISTRHVVESMHKTANPPSILINASAIGYYGERGDEVLTEHASRGTGFLADVVADWEHEALAAESFGTRVVCVRTAPVVGHGGMLAELTKSARFGFLVKLTRRDFWQSWIHEDDIVHAYLFALQTSTMHGPINAVASEVVTHATFMQTLGHVIKRRVIGTLPAWISRRLFGDLAGELTKSARVSSQLLVDKGFVFVHPTLTDALIAATKKDETH